MEGAEDLDAQALKDSPASGAGERSDSGGGNWRDPPRPSRLRKGGWSAVTYNR
ncbi:MAG: hypothetical protein ACRDQZ_19745 [Mycobacteriales bacterium]